MTIVVKSRVSVWRSPYNLKREIVSQNHITTWNNVTRTIIAHHNSIEIKLHTVIMHEGCLHISDLATHPHRQHLRDRHAEMDQEADFVTDAGLHRWTVEWIVLPRKLHRRCRNLEWHLECEWVPKIHSRHRSHDYSNALPANTDSSSQRLVIELIHVHIQMANKTGARCLCIAPNLMDWRFP